MKKPLDAAQIKLGQFVEDHIPFDELKKAGFFDKGTRRNDYKRIAERVCKWFGYQSIFEYKIVCRGPACKSNNCDRSNKRCKNYDPQTQWKPLDFDMSEMYSQDRYLN
jgi:hypothetical protein